MTIRTEMTEITYLRSFQVILKLTWIDLKWLNDLNDLTRNNLKWLRNDFDWLKMTLNDLKWSNLT